MSFQSTAVIAAVLLLLFGAHIEAKTAKKRGVAVHRKCEPPKRWIEVDALADDAGRPSKVVCK